MSEDIQAEPPRRYCKPDLDDFPDFLIRKPRRPYLWVVGTMCNTVELQVREEGGGQ